MIEFLLNHLTYPYIFLAMLLESTVVPIPSELIVAPAAYHAAAGYQDVFIIVLLATLGADCGATINYLVARIYGRPVIYRFANSKWGRMCLLNQEKVERSEHYFDKHGVVATLTGRLVPVIRHLISLPAGLARMNYWKFLLYTTIGAGVWHSILAALGWYFHSVMSEEEMEQLLDRSHHYLVAAVLLAIAAVVVYYIFKSRQKTSNESNDK
ncbi:MAG: DedA family protein [Prevotella sp.]|nr:DedA family protein [Prevotella sp.]